MNMVSGNEKCHDYRINSDGSSKGIESDLAVVLINESKTSNFGVETIISDEDATAMNTVKKCVDHEVGKMSDSNHAKKTVGNSLHRTQKKYKVQQIKVTSYLEKCFPTVQHKTKATQMEIEKL